MVHLRLYVPNIPNYSYQSQSSEDDYSLNSISSEYLFNDMMMAPSITQHLLETRLNVKYESKVLDFTYYPLTGKT